MEFNKLIGKVIFKYIYSEDRLDFYCTNGYIYSLYHDQDCCESVTIDDINGDLDDLLEAPILIADESSREATSDEAGESGTWTFYRLSTINGHLTIKWLGVSNGYYSESVTFSRSDENHLDEWRDWKITKLLD